VTRALPYLAFAAAIGFIAVMTYSAGAHERLAGFSVGASPCAR